MALYLDPVTNPEAYVGVVFAGKLRTPGKCTVTGWARKNDYDHKKGKGTKGSTSTLKGQPPAEGEIEFETWTPEDRLAWNPILARLAYKPQPAGAAPQATSGSTAPTSPGSNFTGGQSGTPAAVTPGTIPAPGDSTSASASSGSASSNNGGGTPLTKADAIDIFYPTLADIGVHFVLPPESLGAWEPVGDDYSHMKRKIKFVEWKQDDGSNIATTPDGSDDGSAADAALPGAGAGAVPGSAASGQASSAAAAAGGQAASGAA